MTCADQPGQPKPAIRPATADDVTVIDAMLHELAHAVGEPGAYSGDVQALTRFGFGDPPVYHALLAEQDTSAVGLCIYFAEFSTWRCRPGIYIQDLYVDPELRGGGLGRDLIATAIGRGRAQWQAAYLRLAVHVWNEPALAFYERLGFRHDPDNRVMVLSGAAFENLA